jgi:hypothetical protein
MQRTKDAGRFEVRASDHHTYATHRSERGRPRIARRSVRSHENPTKPIQTVRSELPGRSACALDYPR